MALDPTRFDPPVIINKEQDEYYKQPMYYAMGQISKFISPDSVRIGIDLPNKLNKLSAVALQRPDNATVVVVLNTNEEPIELTIDDPKNGTLTHVISAHSIQSYIWK